MTPKMIPFGSVLLVAVLLAALAPAARAQALVPCSITAIDARTGVVAAKVNASGATFQFRVTDAKLLAGLHVGQGVYANFTTNQVSLDGKTMCCSIISPPQAAAPPAGPVTVPKTAPAAAPTAAPVAAGPIRNQVTALRQPASAAQAPAFSPVGGTFFVQDLGSGVRISDATTGAVIYYTTDGSTPTTSSTKYGGSIPVSSTTTIKAMATASGMTNSAIATATYTIPSPTCPAGSVLEGVDVSEYQGTPIDWNKVRASGRTFAYARASKVIRGTTGMDYVDDPSFAQNYAAIKAAGLLRGAYHTFDATADPHRQADSFISRIGTLQPGDLPPALAIEWQYLVYTGQGPVPGSPGSTFQGKMSQWMTEVQAVTGRTPIVYSSAPSLQQALGSGTSGDLIWISNWGVTCPTLPAGSHQWVFWQYAGNGTVPGIQGQVHLSRFNGTLADLNSLAKR